MANLDLNNARDFARLTMGSLGGLAQTLSTMGKDPSKWDIEEGSFKGIKFHIFKEKGPYNAALDHIADKGGRRKVKYQYPYVDGQTTADLGRKAESFEAEILLFGAGYMQGLTKLIEKFNSPTPGELVHPVRGKIWCVVEDWDLTHTNDKRKAVGIRATFIEHNFTVGDIRKVVASDVKSKLSKAIALFAALDKAIVNVTGAVGFALSLKNQLAQGIRDVKDQYQRVLTRMNAKFNTRGSQDIPGLLPVNTGGTGSVGSGANYNNTMAADDPFASIPQGVSDTTATALAANEMIKQATQARALIASTIAAMQAAGDGQGSLEWHDDIQAMKQAAIAIQDVLETGIASNNAKIINYVIPANRAMSIREVAFANGVSPDRSYELDLLNPELESVNYIPAGTTVRVPVA